MTCTDSRQQLLLLDLSSSAGFGTAPHNMSQLQDAGYSSFMLHLDAGTQHTLCGVWQAGRDAPCTDCVIADDSVRCSACACALHIYFACLSAALLGTCRG
jgi:hypothetical protein